MSALGLIVAAVTQTATAAVFAPPLETPIRFVVTEVREDDRRRQSFTIDRRVVFRRSGDGFTAEVETLAVTGDAGRAGQMFEAMARAMLGRRVVLMLDRSGKVTDAANADALWDAQLAAMRTTLATKDPARAAVTDGLLAPLRDLPREAKVARLGAVIAPLIPTGPIGARGQRAVVVPVRAHDGTQHSLSGTERVLVEADGTLVFERDASGTVSGAITTQSLRRRIDPRSGLIVSTTATDTIVSGQARLTITRSTTRTP